jgi:hypothetical protein
MFVRFLILAMLTGSFVASATAEPAPLLLKTSGQAKGEIVGQHPSASGNWIVAGTTSLDPNAAGAVEIFKRDGAGWSHAQRIISPTPQAGDAFGDQTAIKGDLLAVGAFGARSGNVAGAGQVHIYRLVGPAWVYEATLDYPDAADNAGFGHFVEISEGRIYVGEVRGHETGGWADNRAVYEFSRAGDRWTVTNIIRPPADLRVPPSFAESAAQQKIFRGAGFGNHFDVDGNRMAISAMGAGAVLLYDRIGAVWIHRQTLDNMSEADTVFGRTVALDGDTLVTGALLADGTVRKSGIAYVYRRAGDRWLLHQRLEAPNASANDMFGHWADISGTRIVVGAFRYTGNGAPQSGAAFVYTLNGSQWALTNTLAPSAQSERQFTAYAVELSGDTFAFTSGDEMGAARGNSVLTGGGIWTYQLEK